MILTKHTFTGNRGEGDGTAGLNMGTTEGKGTTLTRRIRSHETESEGVERGEKTDLSR